MARLESSTAVARPRTFLNLVIDKSSSMEDVRALTIKAVNAFMAQQRGVRIDELFVSLFQFSDAVHASYTAVPIERVADLGQKDYRPDGMTALYDGVWTAIRSAEKAAGKGDRVLIVIATDGEENCSCEVTSAAEMRKIVLRYAERGNWTFVFLGANGDAVRAGTAMGVKPGNVQDFSVRDVGEAMAKVSAGLVRYRTSDDLQTESFYEARKFRRTAWAAESVDDAESSG